MRSFVGYALVAALAAFAASTAFSQIARPARGGEADIQVKASQVSVKLDAPAKTKPQPTTSDTATSGNQSGEALLAALFGGVAGLVAAAAEAAQRIFQEKTKEPWSPAKEIGATEPLGFFDPLNLAGDAAVARQMSGIVPADAEQKFRKFRTAEIKHGRVAMMAAAGLVIQHYVKLPFFQDVPSGVAALQTAKGKIAAGLLFALCGYMELNVWKQDDAKEPGNFGDPAGWSQTGLGGGSYNKTMRERELNNGRFAMIASMGIIAAELTSGKDAIQQLTLKSASLPNSAPALPQAAASLAETAASLPEAAASLPVN